MVFIANDGETSHVVRCTGKLAEKAISVFRFWPKLDFGISQAAMRMILSYKSTYFLSVFSLKLRNISRVRLYTKIFIIRFLLALE